jgi:hypothetical protein
MDVRCQFHATAVLSTDLTPWYPLDRRRIDGTRTGQNTAEKKKSLPLPRIKP